MEQQKSIEARALSASEYGMKFIIRNNRENLQAAELLKGVQLLQKEVNSTFDSIIAKAYSTHKEAKAKKAKFADPLKKAEISYKEKMAAFDTLMEVERVKEENQLRAEADKKAEKLKDKAVEALKNGDENKAEKFTQKAAEVFTPSVAPKHEKPENVSFIIYYEGQIIDQNKIPRKINGVELWSLRENLINKMVNESKGTIKIPGVQNITKKRVAGRSA